MSLYEELADKYAITSRTIQEYITLKTLINLLAELLDSNKIFSHLFTH